MICGQASEKRGWSEWRQYQYNARTYKRKCHKISKLKRSTARSQVKQQAQIIHIEQAHQDYIEVANDYLSRASHTRAKLLEESSTNLIVAAQIQQLDKFICHAKREIDQIRRRVLQGEIIPHEEKVFSIFEEHTEWISKGKAGVPVELGLKVAVVEDQYRFILHHQILQKTQDVEAAVSLVQESKDIYEDILSASFDKGFYSSENKKELAEMIDLVVMPKKGKLSTEDIEYESAPEFVKLRKKHAAVESAINALENHGLDRCLDHGLDGFNRYVALAVVARNVLRLGQILHRASCRRKRHKNTS
jgi:hypothetical protein